MKTSSEPISLRQIQIKDEFWKQEMELVRTEVIPYQWEALNDRIPDAAPSFCMRNFKVAGKITKARREQGKAYQEKIWPLNTFETLPEDMEHMEERFYGFLFQDSDFAKWIEAVGYSLTQHPDEALEKLADEAIDIVCAAQQENGYLDTYYIINDMSKVFTNLRDNHELYCFGHLTEGAAAYYQATGKDKLLKAAERYADYIASCFGAEEGKKKGYPGHEIAEMALVRLYEASGNDKYLKLSKFFIDERGKKPYYFDQEHPENVKKGQEDALRYHYHQAHLPVREQEEAVGHAVRAVYLYSGMADVARLTGDEKLFEACERLWENITEKKMYITGGIGGTHIGEAFSFNYDLPNDTAYAETCASIGLVFFGRRMLQMKADRKYADVMERALFNGILSGMALDGKSFFYVNPLEVNPKACKEDQRKAHVKPVRQKWFGCACCPPNIARLLSSIASYAYTELEDTLFIHLYIGGTIKKKVKEQEAELLITSGFPWNGNVTITNQSKEPIKYTLALRIPSWAENYQISESAVGKTEAGYLYIEKEWAPQETLQLEFSMNPVLMQAQSQVTENLGKVAVMRGPVVYCMEEIDNGKDLGCIQINRNTGFKAAMEEIGGQKMLTLEAEGRRQQPEKDEIPSLYNVYKAPVYTETKVKLIPYYAWANRGEGEMSVWIR